MQNLWPLHRDLGSLLPQWQHLSATYAGLPAASHERAPIMQRLLRARATMAKIVEAHGDTYWPLFERLDQEIEGANSRATRLANAKNSTLAISGQAIDFAQVAHITPRRPLHSSITPT